MENILVIDIETVSAQSNYDLLNERQKELWFKKFSLMPKTETGIGDTYFSKAGIFAEFGKVIVIGLGYFKKNEKGNMQLRVKSLFADNEHELLSQFVAILKDKFPNPNLTLCAHNGKEFDFPYLCRRLVINQIPIPFCLDSAGKKPWEIKHFDTLEMWKFGDKKNYTSLDLLACSLNIPSSKTDMDGSQVNYRYYKENHLKEIAAYCMEDVIVTAQVFLRMNYLELISEENIIKLI